MLTRYQPRILSLFVLAGLDCLIAKPAGQAAELIALDDVARGAYQLEPCSNQESRQHTQLSSALLAFSLTWPMLPSWC
jgi:hypothetical protein